MPTIARDRTAILADRSLPTGAAWRLPLTIGAAFSLTGKFVEARLRGRHGQEATVFYCDSTTASALTVSGQNITILAEPDAVSEAASATTTLADVSDLVYCEYAVDVLDADGGTVLMRIQGNLDWTDYSVPDGTAGSASAVTVSVADATATTVTVSGTGSDGVSAYVYVGYASDASGSDFTTTPDETSTYVAFLSTDAEIASPAAGDFAGLWVAIGGAGDVATHAALTSGVHGISAYGATLVDDADAAAARTTLGLGTAATAATGAFEAAGAVSTHAAVTSGVHGISAYGATLVDDADAAAARTTLGLGTAATAATGAFEAAGAVSTHAAITSGVHGISAFGATLVDDADAATARTTLGVDAAGTDNSTDVTLAGTPDYITISGQVITRNAIDLATDITGTLPAANGGTGQTSLGAVDAADLGSGAATDGYVLTADGLGGSAWEAVAGGGGSGTVTSVAISGSDGIQVDSGSPITSSGTIALGVDAATLRSHINVEDGATADQTASEILTAIKTVDGTGSGLDADLLDGNEASAFATAGHNHDGTYQPLDSDLTAIAALTPTDSNFIVGDGTAWVAESGATARTSLGLGTAATSNTGDFEAAGAVSTHAAVTSGVHGISAFGATLVDDADAAAARTTLGVDAAGTDNSTDVTLAGTPDYITISGQVITRNAVDLTTDITGTLSAANGGTGQTSLGAVDAADLGSGAATDGYVLTADGLGGSAWEAVAGGGTVTSVAVSGTDGIDVDSGSPITGSGTITLGINAATLSTHLSLGDAATKNTGTSAGTVAAGDHTHSGVYVPVAAITTESTTTRTLALTDAHDWIHCTNASGCTITVPPQADVAWADGTVIYGDQGAAGAVTIAAGSGVTINCADTLVTDGQHSTFAIVRISSNVWILTGRLVA